MGEDLLGTPVSFSNSAFHHRARSQNYPAFDIGQREEYVKNNDSASYYETILLCMEKTTDNTPYILRAKDTVPRYISKAYVNGKHVGHFTVPQVDIPIEQMDTRLIQLICDACAMTYAMESVSFAFDDYFLPEVSILESLYHGNFKTEAEFQRYASLYTFSQYTAFRAVYIAGKGIRNVDFRSTLLNACISSGIKQWIFANDHSFIMLLAADGADKLSDERMRALAPKTFDRFDVIAGISDPFACIIDMRQYVDYAQRVAQLEQHKSGTHMVIQDDCKMQLFFHDVSHALDDPRAYCATALMNIAKHDEENGTEYYATLRHYLQCGMSPTQAAGQMFVHKNTVLYRIRCLEELFGLVLSDMNVVYQLLLSYSLMDRLPKS